MKYCDKCIFSFQSSELKCRRFPPQVIADGVSGTTVWPTVSKYTWCGEFQPRPDSGEK